MFYGKKQLKQREKLKSCKYNLNKTGKAYGCGSGFEAAFKCGLHGECVLQKVCKKPDTVLVCEKCNDWIQE